MSERDPKTGRFPPGNGPGWGGGRQGEGHRFVEGDPLAGRPVGMKAGEGRQAQVRAYLLDKAMKAAERVVKIMEDDTDSRNLQAAFGVLDRTGIHTKAGVEVGGEGGGPLIVERVIVDPQNRDTEGV